MSDHLISVSGEEVHIDESDGLQTSGVATAFEDNDDNDVALATIPGVLATRLNAITGTYANSSTANLIEAAVSDSEVITVNAGQSYDNLALTASDGTLLNDDPSGMTTTDDHDIRLYTDTTNDNIAYGVDSVTGLLVFVVYLEETAAGANIWVLMYDSVTQLDSPNNYDEAIDLTNKIYVTAFDENEFSLANAPPGDNLFMAFGDDQQAIVVTGKNPANQSEGDNISSGDTVNTSGQTSTSIGTNGQQFKAGEGMYVTFVIGMNPDYTAGPGAGNNPGEPLSQTEADVEANIDFTDFLDATGAEFTVSQVNPGSSGTSVKIKLVAYIHDEADPLDEAGEHFVDELNDDTRVLIDGVTINGGAATWSYIDAADHTLGVYVEGVVEGDIVGYTTDGDHTRVLIENAQPLKGAGSNRSFDIGGFKLTQVASDVEEVGSKIFFEDDGPMADVGLTGTEPDAVYLFDGNQSGGNFQGNNDEAAPTDDATRDGSPTSVDVGFSGAFSTTTSTGEDDEGASTSSAYSLVLSASTGSTVQFGGGDLESGGIDVIWKEITAGQEYQGVLSSDNTTEVFSLSVNTTTGVVTFSQSMVFDHGTNNSGPFSTDTLLLDDGQIAVRKTVTVTDGDADEATDYDEVDLGGNFGVGDDGPKADVTLTGSEPAVKYLFDGDLSGGNFQGDNGTGAPSGDEARDGLPSPHAVTSDFSTAFGGTASAGADGGGAVTPSYALVLAGGLLGTQVMFNDGSSDIGLTSGGVSVVWDDDGGSGDYIGLAGATEVFRLSVDSSGVVTFTQSVVFDHPDIVTTSPYTTDLLTLSDGQISVQKSVTSTDSEGDSASDSESVDLGGNFGVGDDGPTADVTVSDPGLATKYTFDGDLANGNFQGNNGALLPTGDQARDGLPSPNAVSQDFSSAFGGSATSGADGGGSVTPTYSLVLGAGLLDSQVMFNDGSSDIGLTSNGTTVLWKASGDDFIGDAGGTEVFRLSVDSSGMVTFTQSATFDHNEADTGHPYTTDILTLSDDQISVQKSVTSTDSEGDSASDSDSLDLGGYFGVGDDGPNITVDDITGIDFSAAFPVDGTWAHSAGADGFTSLNITLVSYSIDDDTPVVVNTSLGTLTAPNDGTDFVYTGSVTGDFTPTDGIDNEQTVNFELTFQNDGTYEFDLTTPPGTVTTFDTTQGTVAAGGPQYVRQLNLGGDGPAGNDDILFFAAVATAPLDDTGPGTPLVIDSIAELVKLGEPDLTAAEIVALVPLPGVISSTSTLNVSTSGFGFASNNINGADEGEGTGDFAGTSITSGDQSMVVNPETLVDKVTVYVSNTTGQYDFGDEELYITVYYADGTNSGPMLVDDLNYFDTKNPADDTFYVEAIGDNLIDAVQLTMGLGAVKIHKIAFTVNQDFDPASLDLNFTSTLVDNDNGDNDSSTDTFAIQIDEVV